MDGIHDLGGKQGYGRVLDGETTDQVGFSEHWHALVFSMINTLHRTGTAPNVDYFRHAVERIDPVNYLDDGYYGRWLGAAETILVESGLITQQEVNERALAMGAAPGQRVAARPGTRAEFAERSQAVTSARPLPCKARFKQGDRVVTQGHGVAGHTRLPAYARGVSGQIVALHGGWVYPDDNAHGSGENPQHLYTVAFAAADLWGPTGEADVTVCLDLFEPYLENFERNA